MPVDANVPKAPLSPAQMLIAHERRLTEIERIIPEMIRDLGLDAAEDNLAMSDQGQFASQSGLTESADVLALTRRLDTIEMTISSIGKSSGASGSNHELQAQADELDRRINTLTELVQFVQKFTMETNLTLMRLIKKLGVDVVDFSESKDNGSDYGNDDGLVMSAQVSSVEREVTLQHAFDVGR
jgi:hypothetical protein